MDTKCAIDACVSVMLELPDDEEWDTIPYVEFFDCFFFLFVLFGFV